MALQRLQPRKGSLMLYIALLAAAVALMVSARQCSTKRIGPAPDNHAGGDTLNVAIEISPTSLSLSGDTLSGTYYDLLRQVCARHGQPLQFHPYTRFEDALQWLDEGRCRLIVGDLPVTAELRDRLIFLDPVAIDKQVLVQRVDTAGNVEVKTQFDLANRAVFISSNSPYIQRLRNLSREIGDTIYISENPDYSAEQLVVLTALGEIPMTVVSASTAKSLAPKYDNLDISVEISLNQFQSWALAPSDTILQKKLNSWLHEK